MQIIQSRREIEKLHDSQLIQSIQGVIEQIEQDYQETYQATQHGWFIVCETLQDFQEPISELRFSLAEKLRCGEVEFIEKQQNWYEICVLLNDTEGILVYVPHVIFEQHQSTMM